MNDKATGYERITAAILAALAGDVPTWRRPWRTIRAAGAQTVPQNAVTGRAYRGINAALLSIAPYQDQRYLTYKQAADLGGHVRKGQHGHQVVFWQKRTFTERDTATGEESKRSSLLLKLYTVFNVSQCDGLSLPRATAVEPVAVPDLIRRLYEGTGATVNHSGDAAYYSPGADQVTLPRVEAFTSTDAYAATAFHEFGHWTGHGSRLARDLTGRFGSKAYAAEELVAELAAAYLCAEFGVDMSLEHHAAYIGHWRTILANDSRAIVTAASKAQAAADLIRQKMGAENAGAEDADQESGEQAAA